MSSNLPRIAIVERGHGVPVVLIPGIQGRWQYFEPAFEALSTRCRAITFSLDGEPGSGQRFDRAAGFDGLALQVDRVLDQLAIDRAVLCGVSFGGLVALRYAVTRPTRTAGLILVSTPGPGFHLRPRHEIYARLPWLFGPVFLAEMPSRVGREIAEAMPDRVERRRFRRRQVRTFMKAPLSLSRMAARARLIGGPRESDRRRHEATAVRTPTLVLSGESHLDYVVPTEGTSEYTTLIRGARAICIERSGHLGCVTRPEAFAEAVADFVRGSGLSGRHDPGHEVTPPPIDRSRDDAA
jgi:pimeloyl-ACP methyl ester carboxylesterase